jgi:hypothetical protein
VVKSAKFAALQSPGLPSTQIFPDAGGHCALRLVGINIVLIRISAISNLNPDAHTPGFLSVQLMPSIINDLKMKKI